MGSLLSSPLRFWAWDKPGSLGSCPPCPRRSLPPVFPAPASSTPTPGNQGAARQQRELSGSPGRGNSAALHPTPWWQRLGPPAAAATGALSNAWGRTRTRTQHVIPTGLSRPGISDRHRAHRHECSCAELLSPEPSPAPSSQPREIPPPRSYPLRRVRNAGGAGSQGRQVSSQPLSCRTSLGWEEASEDRISVIEVNNVVMHC